MLNERRQRQLVRGIFLTVGLAPMFVIALLAVVRRLPSHTAAHQQQVAAVTGWQIQLHAVRHPAPGELRADGIVVRDRISGRRVGQAHWASWRSGPGGLEVRLARPVVYLDESRPVADQLLQLCAPLSRPLHRVHLDCTELTVCWRSAQSAEGRSHRQSFHNVQVDTTEPGGLRITGRLPLSDPSVRLSMDRRSPRPSDDGQALSSQITLQVDQPLRIGALHPGMAEWLGVDATFQGSLRWKSEGEGPNWDLQGVVDRVAMERVIGLWSPYRLRGTARLELTTLQLRGGRIKHASGTLEIQAGEIDPQPIAALANLLELPMDDSLDPDARSLAFQQLRLAFSIDGSHWTVSPIGIETGDSALVVQQDGQALLRMDQPRRLPVTALVDVLIPASEHRVSATAASQRILALFAWPEVARRTASAEDPPTGIIRGLHQ